MTLNELYNVNGYRRKFLGVEKEIERIIKRAELKETNGDQEHTKDVGITFKFYI